MKMQVRAVLTAFQTLVLIMNRRPTLPQAAHYRLARAHKALQEEAKTAEESRTKIIMELGHEIQDAEGKLTGNWEVPEKDAEGRETETIKTYRERWGAIADAEIEVAVQPMSITIFGDETDGLQAAEILHLGELITD
ncbi:MAG: hypothetical protein Q7R68_11125 [Nitrospirales bacterium]|nr:hypothetical protein [Nitrospirales bacterium]